MIPGVGRVEVAIPEEVSLRTFRQVDSDDESITSEISLDILVKEREEERDNQSVTSGGWNPDDSDYSLNVLLPSKDDDPSVSDSDKGSMVTSDYSLNLKLPKIKQKMTPSKYAMSASKHSLSASTHSFDTFATSRSASIDSFASSEQEAEPSPSKVTFYPRVRIQRVPNRKDLPKKQIQQVWYCREDLKDIRRECFDTIKMMKDDDLIDEEEGLCSRGLEYKTPKNYKMRQRNKVEVRQVVMDEQEFQRENSMQDPEWIARVSKEQSRECVEAAIVTARKDEEAAQQIHGLDDPWE